MLSVDLEYFASILYFQSFLYPNIFQKEALRVIKQQAVINAGQIQPSWTFQVLPSLYQHSQKVVLLAPQLYFTAFIQEGCFVYALQFVHFIKNY